MTDQTEKAVAAFSEKMKGGLKNVRFFIMPGSEASPDKLAEEINRIEDSMAVGLCEEMVDPDVGLSAKVDIQAVVDQLESQHPL